MVINEMLSKLILSLLLITQASAERTAQNPRGDLNAVFERASKESDLDGAGLILSSLLSDESTIRLALSTTAVLDERSVYILFGEHWGPRAKVSWKDNKRWHRILVESVSAKPVLVRSVIHADRYKSYFRSRNPGGTATINAFPFFEFSLYADDLVEAFMETLRRETTRPAKALESQDKIVLVTADEMEVNFLAIWQMLCGVCDRLELIDKATTKNWRERFPELDKWFQKNRPYIVWDNSRSCIRIDEDAKELARPTPRTSRSIPKLKPPW